MKSIGDLCDPCGGYLVTFVTGGDVAAAEERDAKLAAMTAMTEADWGDPNAEAAWGDPNQRAAMAEAITQVIVTPDPPDPSYM